MAKRFGRGWSAKRAHNIRKGKVKVKRHGTA